jgi:ABC-2 type transport system ATP-binding protein
MIILEKITFSYPGSSTCVLNNLTVSFEKGSVNVLLGLNGAGKTTLFDIITGTYEPNSGKIINKPDVSQIVYQTQSGVMSFLLNGKDYVRLIHKLSGIDYCNDAEKMQKRYYFDTEREKQLFLDLWNRRIGNMSVGERRWLYVTVLSQLNRGLYIFDEPTTGIDPLSRLKIYKRIEKLTIQKDAIVVFSTHHLHELRDLKCKLFVLNKGSIYFEGSYNQFIKHYDTDNPDIAFERCITFPNTYNLKERGVIQ